MIRSSLIGLGLAVVGAVPAMAACTHTQDAVIYDNATKTVQAVVIPSCDSELSDPAFNRTGSAQTRVLHVNGQDPVTSAKMIVPSLSAPADLQAAVQAGMAASLSASTSIANKGAVVQ